MPNARGNAPRGTRAGGVQALHAFRVLLALFVGAFSRHDVGDHVRREHRSGIQLAAELFGQRDKVHDWLTRDAAAVVAFGNEHRRPAQRGTIAPDGAVERVGFLEEPAQRTHRMVIAQEATRGVPQQLLFFGVREMHARRLCGSRRC